MQAGRKPDFFVICESWGGNWRQAPAAAGAAHGGPVPRGVAAAAAAAGLSRGFTLLFHPHARGMIALERAAGNRAKCALFHKRFKLQEKPVV